MAILVDTSVLGRLANRADPAQVHYHENQGQALKQRWSQTTAFANSYRQQVRRIANSNRSKKKLSLGCLPTCMHLQAYLQNSVCEVDFPSNQYAADSRSDGGC